MLFLVKELCNLSGVLKTALKVTIATCPGEAGYSPTFFLTHSTAAESRPNTCRITLDQSFAALALFPMKTALDAVLGKPIAKAFVFPRHPHCQIHSHAPWSSMPQPKPQDTLS